ncbi:nucleotidyltransferase [Cohnella suwonensis]|uniref:tRNA(Met) cytidine acetate ligase n=1 Tax=Cohnella suwonensis TaxID=696072 RepID=A0ABW0M1G9_9BACL
MSTVGVIVEYNPLHNGHLYHLQQSKKITGADGVVAVMSGHFLQRGEPAMADKWARTEMALLAGCDLVLELPVAFSSQPAQWFAYGAVAVLEATGIVDSLCFGSESGDIASLLQVSAMLAEEPPAFVSSLEAELKTGLPYPSAFANAAAAYLRDAGKDDLSFSLSQPNHTLGLHYLFALRKLNSRIVPHTVRREKSDYGQSDITDARIASATALRKLLFGEAGSLDGLAPFVPPTTLEVLRRETDEGRAPVHWEHFARPLFHELFRQSPERLAEYAEVAEGLEHRIKNVLRDVQAYTVSSLLDELKTKRYTRTKLQRTLLRILLGHRKELLTASRLANGVDYVRVLGFTERGRGMLKTMRGKATVPVVGSAAEHDSPYLEMDAQATAAYALAMPAAVAGDAYRDFTKPPIRV